MKKGIKKLSNFLYGKEPFELVFEVPPKDAARRLSSHVHKTAFTGLGTERMIGDVSVITGIRLQRFIPFGGNQSQHVMVGMFTEEEGKTKITGVFRLDIKLQVFITMWLGLHSLLSFKELIYVITTPAPASMNLLVGPFMFCIGIGLIKICKYFLKDDKRWLIEKVTIAIEQDFAVCP